MKLIPWRIKNHLRHLQQEVSFYHIDLKGGYKQTKSHFCNWGRGSGPKSRFGRWIANVFIRWLCSNSSCKVGGGPQIGISRGFWLVKALTINIVSWLDATHLGWGFCNEASTSGKASFFLFLPTSSLSIPFSRNALCFPSLAAKYTEPPVRLVCSSHDPLSLETFRGGWIRQASDFHF